MALHGLVAGAVFAGDYLVVRPIAEGGMGAVYEVEQRSTGRRRALKVLRPTLVGDDATRARFLGEARASARIESDHIVEVIDSGIDEGTGAPFLVMELLDGEDLHRFVTQRSALDPAEAREILRQLCHALAAAHAAGVVHRDLKPENVFVARSRRADGAYTVKLLDFGIASILEGDATSHRTGAVVGSPAWMAPEQVDTGRIRPSTDVWALGLLAFWLITGRHYWKSANSANATLQALLVEKLVEPLEPASVRARWLGVAEGRVDPAFDRWFARCVCREPEGRFADAGAAFSALSAAPATGGVELARTVAYSVAPTVLAGPTGEVTGYGPRRASRAPQRAAVLVASLVCVGGAAFAWQRLASKGHGPALTATAEPARIAARDASTTTVVARATVPPEGATPDAGTTLALSVGDAAAPLAPRALPAPERRPTVLARVERSVERSARTISARDASATGSSVVASSVGAPSTVGAQTIPSSSATAGGPPPGPRPNRCAAYASLERQADGFLARATAIEATDPRQAQRDRMQAIALRDAVDTQVAQLHVMARGDLAGDPDFVAMVRDVDQCIARLRRGP